MDISIYKITNPNGCVYVGKTRDIKKRFRQYEKYAKVITQPKLQYSIIKHGWENHKIEILEVCHIKYSNSREIYWVKECNSYAAINKNGLNLTPGGDGGKGGRKNKNCKKVYQWCKNNVCVVKEWNSVKEVSDFLKVSRNSIYAAIKGKKQILCKGFLWSYKYEVPLNRAYKTKDIELSRIRGENLKTKYREGIMINPQTGKTGCLNKRSLKVKWVQGDMVFESVRIASKYFINNNIINKKEKTISELIIRSARGLRAKKDNFNFIFV